MLNRLFGSDSSIVHDRAFQVLLFVNLSPPLGAALVSPLLDTLTGKYGVTEAQIGLVMTAFTAPSIVLIPVIGVLADRYGRKSVMLCGLLLFGIGGTALAFTTDFRTVLFLRFVQGIGFGGLTPIIVASIGDFYEGEAEATAQGIRFASSGLTLLLFPFLGGVLVALAWNAPFVVYALPFPAAVLLYHYFEEPLDVRTERRAMTGIDDLLAFIRHRRAAALLLGRSIPNFVYLSFLTYNSFIVVRGGGGTPEQAGLLVAVTSIAHALTATQAGRVTAHFASRFYPLTGASIALGGGLALLGAAPNFATVVFAGVAVGAGFGLSLSLYRSILTGIAPPEIRGGIVSTGSSLGRVTSTLAPLALGTVVGLWRPVLGFTPAVRGAVIVAGVASALCGVISLVVAYRAPPLATERTEPVSGDD